MQPTAATDQARRTLSRSLDGRLIAGVALGLADYLDVDVVVVRVLFVVLTLVGGIGIPLYLAAWLLVPEEDRDESIAEQLLGRTRPDAGLRSDADRPRGPDHQRSDGVTTP